MTLFIIKKLPFDIFPDKKFAYNNIFAYLCHKFRLTEFIYPLYDIL